LAAQISEAKWRFWPSRPCSIRAKPGRRAGTHLRKPNPVGRALAHESCWEDGCFTDTIPHSGCVACILPEGPVSGATARPTRRLHVPFTTTKFLHLTERSLSRRFCEHGIKDLAMPSHGALASSLLGRFGILKPLSARWLETLTQTWGKSAKATPFRALNEPHPGQAEQGSPRDRNLAGATSQETQNRNGEPGVPPGSKGQAR